ncbi:hypothetical protein SLE2022_371010 [Rubroshorea leprosula]
MDCFYGCHFINPQGWTLHLVLRLRCNSCCFSEQGGPTSPRTAMGPPFWPRFWEEDNDRHRRDDHPAVTESDDTIKTRPALAWWASLQRGLVSLDLVTGVAMRFVLKASPATCHPPHPRYRRPAHLFTNL